MTEQRIREILEEIAGQIDGLLSIMVIDLDGVAVVNYIPPGSMVNVELAAAQLAILIKLLKSTADRLRAGEVEDDLLTTSTTQVLIKPLVDKYYLGIMTTRDNSLGMVRLVAGAYVNNIRRELLEGSEGKDVAYVDISISRN